MVHLADWNPALDHGRQIAGVDWYSQLDLVGLAEQADRLDTLERDRPGLVRLLAADVLCGSGRRREPWR